MKYLILICVFSGGLLFGQKCYIDGNLLATNGEHGKAVSFIFTDDFRFCLDTMSGDSGNTPVEIIQESMYLYGFRNSPESKFIITDDELFIEYLENGIVFSTMKKVDCNKDVSENFLLALKE